MSPLERVLEKLDGVRQSGTCFSALCPSHADRSPSLSVTEAGDDKRVLLHCHAGCTAQNIVDALGLKLSDLFVKGSATKKTASPGSDGNAPLTLEQLAIAKGLPLEYLSGQLGWSDITHRGLAAVQIPYRRRDGSPARTRIRFSLEGQRFCWERSAAPLAVYEPDLGVTAKEQKFVVLVEGETDTAILGLHGFPALGIPGATNTKYLERDHLQGLDAVYYVREPGDGGDTFADGVRKRLVTCGFTGPLHEIRFEHAKDPIELNEEDPAGFPERMRAAIAAAVSSDYQVIPVDGSQPPVDNEHEVVVGELPHTVRQAERVLARREVFQRSGSLVHVTYEPSEEHGVMREEGVPTIRPLPEAVLRMNLHEAAPWKKRLEDGSKVDTHVPKDVLMALHQLGQWKNVRRLVGLTHGPLLRPDGTLLVRSGYDAATGLFCSADADIQVPESPTTQQISDAVELLFDLVGDYHFDRPAHASAALSGILTVIARPAIEGPVPASIYDSNMTGTGKTTLAQIIGDVAFGRGVPTRTAPKEGAEWTKSLLTVASAGDPIILFDNAKHSISSEALEGALTSGVIAGRALGTNRDLRLAFRALVAITSNNATISTDLVRRSLHIRLESPLEKPEERDDFKYPRIRTHARANRTQLLSAAFTILRGYIAAGRPDLHLRPMGSFEQWSDLVRSAMVFAGCPDPVDTQATLREAADDDASALLVLLHAWRNHYGDRAVTVGKALADAAEGNSELLRRAILGFADEHGGLPGARRLGNLLKKARGVIVGGLMLQAGPKSEEGLQLRVRSIKPSQETAPTPEAPCTPTDCTADIPDVAPDEAAVSECPSEPP
ncbi:MAG: hypothetical protein RLZZ450_5905 [Pseudomonadota bacterium]|jgi:hypothetical protein